MPGIGGREQDNNDAMKNTPKKLSKQELAAKKQAAAQRKAKSRAKAKEAGLVRFRAELGMKDLAILAEIDVDLGKAVQALMHPHRDDNGRFLLPFNEIGCVWESKAGELDIMLPAEDAEALRRYSPFLTPGEVVEILIGHALDPQWPEDLVHIPDWHEWAALRGTAPDGEPVKMMTAHQAYIRRCQRRWVQARAMGLPADVWEDLSETTDYAYEKAWAFFERAKEWKNWRAIPKEPIRSVSQQGDGAMASWSDVQDVDALVDSALALMAA